MAARDEPEGRQFGQQDDRFELGTKIGAGGQATVYRCTRLRDGNKYAVRIIDTTTQYYASVGEQNLQREIRNMAELYHPRIVNLHHSFWEATKCLIVMDLASEGDLHSRIEREVKTHGSPYKGLGGSEHASRHVACQVIDGIGYMHSNNIIHRDLKLENILVVRSYPCLARHLDPAPRELLDVKIADLGLSKMVESSDEDGHVLVRRHSAVGSPDFVAPEVLSQKYDGAADYWSFGVMLYAMLCGSWPFEISGPADLKRERHLELVSRIKSSESWRLASADAQSMVQGLLTVDVSKRLDRDRCLRHPWILDVPEGDSVHPRLSRRSMSKGRTQSDLSLCEGPTGVVRGIRGCVGYAVDNVVLEMWDESDKFYGGHGGENEGQWTLKEDEMIIGVMQETRPNYLGNAIVFYTSHSQIIPIEGINRHMRHRFVAPRGSQVVGLQFEGSRLVGTFLERVVDGKGVVEQISGRAGHAVDKVEFKLRDGSFRGYGEEGGKEQGPWALLPDEFIMIVEQARRDAFLGNSVIFYTSKGNVIRLQGMHASGTRRFVAPLGQQICGLAFNGSDLVRVSTCPESGNMLKERMHEAVT